MNPIVLPIVGINNLTPAKKKSLPGSRSHTMVVWCATRLRRYRMSYIEVVINEKEQLLILIRRKETGWICCADLFMEIKMAEWLWIIWFLGVVIRVVHGRLSIHSSAASKIQAVQTWKPQRDTRGTTNINAWKPESNSLFQRLSLFSNIQTKKKG